MAILLFKLGNVPEDEASEVRQLLHEGGFNVYETSAGRWRSGVAAIWLADPEQLESARAALDAYQAERVVRVRAEYQQRQANGTAPGLRNAFAAQPVRFVAYLVAVGVIVALMVMPFIGFLAQQ